MCREMFLLFSHKCLILLRSLLCYIWSSSLLLSLFICFLFGRLWNLAMVFILCMVQLANFHVSGHLISIDFVPRITTIISKSSYHIDVHKHGPAFGVTPVLIPLMPLYPSIKCVLYHLYVLLFPFVFFFTICCFVLTTSLNCFIFMHLVASFATSSALALLL